MSFPSIDAARLIGRIRELGEIGRDAEGRLTRLAGSDNDKAGRNRLVAWIEAAGLDVAVDQIGNIFGIWRSEENSGEAPIMLGSHIDTVINAGIYDGCYGVLAALEVIETLKDRGVTPARPIVVAAFTNEEGVRFAPDMLGSLVYAGGLPLDAALATIGTDGSSLGEELERIGYAGNIEPGFLKPHAYVELHIEQGPLLEASATEVGVVTGIQGLRWFDVVITGTEAHAGSTPMAQRDDALVAAAEVVLAVRDIARQNPPGVGTVGFVEVGPNSRNVVPGSVRLQIDMRHPSETGLNQMQAAVEDAVRKAGPGVALNHIWSKAPVVFDPAIVNAVRASTEALGYSATDMVSGAGHDAAHMATITPTAMIFVPSKDGLSHNEAEYTAPEECARGAEVLFQTILEIDRR